MSLFDEQILTINIALHKFYDVYMSNEFKKYSAPPTIVIETLHGESAIVLKMNNLYVQLDNDGGTNIVQEVWGQATGLLVAADRLICDPYTPAPVEEGIQLQFHRTGLHMAKVLTETCDTSWEHPLTKNARTALAPSLQHKLTYSNWCPETPDTYLVTYDDVNYYIDLQDPWVTLSPLRNTGYCSGLGIAITAAIIQAASAAVEGTTLEVFGIGDVVSPLRSLKQVIYRDQLTVYERSHDTLANPKLLTFDTWGDLPGTVH